MGKQLKSVVKRKRRKRWIERKKDAVKSLIKHK